MRLYIAARSSKLRDFYQVVNLDRAEYDGRIAKATLGGGGRVGDFPGPEMRSAVFFFNCRFNNYNTS